MLGKERSLLINRHFIIFIRKEAQSVFANFLEEIFKGKNNAICDVSISCKDDNCLHVNLTGIISENKEQCYITATDITERKNAEDDLRKNLAKYQVLIDTFPIAITISDKAGNIIETNEKAFELLALPREEHLKRKITGEDWKIIKTDGTIFPPDEYASVKALKENRLVENIEMGIVKSEDEITWINVTAAPVPIEEYGVLIAYNDITERKKADEERSKLFAITEKALFGSAICDLNGLILYVNEYFAQIHGYSTNELVGKNLTIFHSEPQLPLVRTIIDEALEKGTIESVEVPHMHKLGHVFPMQMNVIVIKDEHNNPRYLAATAFDLTKQISFEQNLQNLVNDQNIMLDNDPTFIYFKDCKNNIIRVTESVAKATGLIS
jgi:PAS domain S-box-containing protein